MHNFRSIFQEIQEIQNLLIENNLIDVINPVIQKEDNSKNKIIEWSGISNISISLKNISYEKIYEELDGNRDYMFKLLDGALIHMMYTLKNDELISHRLAFYPSPKLEAFQNEPDIYMEDEIYADIVYKNIVAFPIRFDYNKDEVASDFPHPKSHGTLGQYKNCRIPVYGPMSPAIFIEFLFKNFYGTAYYSLLEGKIRKRCTIYKTINEQELGTVHFHLKDS